MVQQIVVRRNLLQMIFQLTLQETDPPIHGSIATDFVSHKLEGIISITLEHRQFHPLVEALVLLQAAQPHWHEAAA